MQLDRRTVLKSSGAGALAGGPFAGFAAMSPAAAQKPSSPELVPAHDRRDGKVRLHLPPGFSYRSFHDTEVEPVVLDDGTVLPGRHDGMGAFRGRKGTSVLVRNHEIRSATRRSPSARAGRTTTERPAAGPRPSASPATAGCCRRSRASAARS